MDKSKLIAYIKELGLDSVVERELVVLIEASELDQKLLDGVASVVEALSKVELMKAEALSEQAEMLEAYKDELTDLEEKYREGSDKMMEDFVAKLREKVSQKGGVPSGQSAAETQTAGVVAPMVEASGPVPTVPTM